MDELAEFEAFIAEVEALRRVRRAAAYLLVLKDGPRDEHYGKAKPGAWEILREALADVERIGGGA